MRQMTASDGDIRPLTSFREQIHETFLGLSRVGGRLVRRRVARDFVPIAASTPDRPETVFPSQETLTERRSLIARAIVGASAGASSAENRGGAGQMTSEQKPGDGSAVLNPVSAARKHGGTLKSQRKRARLLLDRIKRDKGVRWMPWRQEAMKDVALCDKPGGGESTL